MTAKKPADKKPANKKPANKKAATKKEVLDSGITGGPGTNQPGPQKTTKTKLNPNLKKLTDSERRRILAASFKEGIVQDIEELLTDNMYAAISVIDDADESKGSVSFNVKLNLKGADIGSTTKMSFSEKTEASRSRVYQDPAQPQLPLDDESKD